MFAVLQLPDFRLQTALRWREELREKPVAIVDESTTKGVVLEANAAAKVSGVRAGLPSVQAMARCAALVILPGAAAEEKATQSVLLEIAHSLSPEVEDSALGCVTLNLRGIPRTDWNAWCDAALYKFISLELNCKIGVAPNPDLAFLASQKAETFLVVTKPAAFLRGLPLSSIDAPLSLQNVLQDWGIHTLGQLTRLPLAELVNRLGPESEILWQRAAGKTERLLQLVRPVPEFHEAMDFEFEIETMEPLLFILRRFLNQICQRLEVAHAVAAKLVLALLVEGGAEHRREFVIPVPTHDEETLFRIVTTHLEGLELEQRICGMRLWIDPVKPEHQQFRLFDAPIRDTNRFAETLARLGALVGSGNIGVPTVNDSFREDNIRLKPPQFHQTNELAASSPPLVIGLPLKRFRPPCPAQVRLHQHQPADVISAQARGRITDVLGPYRASGSWWDQEKWSAEEWDVEIAGEGLFRLRREENQWVIAGCYDA